MLRCFYSMTVEVFEIASYFKDTAVGRLPFAHYHPLCREETKYQQRHVMCSSTFCTPGSQHTLAFHLSFALVYGTCVRSQAMWAQCGTQDTGIGKHLYGKQKSKQADNCEQRNPFQRPHAEQHSTGPTATATPGLQWQHICQNASEYAYTCEAQNFCNP